MIDLNAIVSLEALSLLPSTCACMHTNTLTDQHIACLDIYQHILETSIWLCITTLWSFKITTFSTCFMSIRCSVRLITCTLFWKSEVCSSWLSGSQCFTGLWCLHLTGTGSPRRNGLPVPWRQRHYNPSKHQAPLSQQHCVTSHKTWIQAILVCPQNKRPHFKIMQNN
jgi:hypothetical protein